MITNSRTLIYSSIYAFVVLANVLAIWLDNAMLISILKPLIVLTIFFMYRKLVKDTKKFYELALLCVFIGDIFYLFETRYFLIAMIFYTINHVVLTFEIFKFKKRIKIYNTLIYFFVLSMAFALVYLLVIRDQKGHDASILLFGVSLCVLSATALVNYLRNMTSPNFYLMLGMLFSLLTNLTISLNAFNLSSTRLVNFFGTLFLAITHYTIFYSFLIRDKE